MAGNVKEEHYKIIYETGGIVKPKGEEQETKRNNALRQPSPASMYQEGGQLEEDNSKMTVEEPMQNISLYKEGGSVEEKEDKYFKGADKPTTPTGQQKEALESIKQAQSEETDVMDTDDGSVEVPVEQKDYVGDAQKTIKERRVKAVKELGLGDINYLQKDEGKDYVYSHMLQDDLQKYYDSQKTRKKYEELSSEGKSDSYIEKYMDRYHGKGYDFHYINNPHPMPED